MGAEPALLALASTIKFEDAHVLTREEIARFGIDRREQSETAVAGRRRRPRHDPQDRVRRRMTARSILSRPDSGGWSVSTPSQFELDFQRPAVSTSVLPTVLISNGGSTSLHFRSRPFMSQGIRALESRICHGHHCRRSCRMPRDRSRRNFAGLARATDSHARPNCPAKDWQTRSIDCLRPVHRQRTWLRLAEPHRSRATAQRNNPRRLFSFRSCVGLHASA